MRPNIELNSCYYPRDHYFPLTARPDVFYSTFESVSSQELRLLFIKHWQQMTFSQKYNSSAKLSCLGELWYSVLKHNHQQSSEREREQACDRALLVGVASAVFIAVLLPLFRAAAQVSFSEPLGQNSCMLPLSYGCLGQCTLCVPVM